MMRLMTLGEGEKTIAAAEDAIIIHARMGGERK
jgi:hypothetical protein